MQVLFRTIFILAFIGGCSPIPTTPDSRSRKEKEAELALSIAELSGEYDVVESRNEIYLYHNFAVARSLKVTASGNNIIFKLIGHNNSELTIISGECGGNIHKLSTNVFCKNSSSGMSYISFGKEKHEYQIKSGALISAFPPLDVHEGDFLLDFVESGSGRPHYYKLRKK